MALSRVDLKKVMSVLMVIFTIAMVAFMVYAVKEGIFKDANALVKFIAQFGVIAPIAFVAIQIVQVIFPVIPGGASCLVGVMAFGPINGFIYNYLGLVIGSVAAFWIPKIYGTAIIHKLFKEEQIDKYMKHLKGNTFKAIFRWGIFLPGAPDDLLCYMAGISTISFRDFMITILLGKPLTLLMYSVFIEYAPDLLAFIG